MRTDARPRLHRQILVACVGLLAALCAANVAHAQPFGVEMHNTMLPVAGAMGGASIAQPQELLGAVNANPAALTRFGGTQFEFAGGYAEATFNFNQTGTLPLPDVNPFAAKSNTPGTSVANIGMSRQSELFGSNVVTGFALISNAGAGVDFRGVPASNGTTSSLLVLEMIPSVGVRLTDRLSVGFNGALGTAYFNGPFVGVGAMVQAYGLRGGVGVNYDLSEATTIGAYWQSKQHFNFSDAIRLEFFGGAFDPIVRSIRMDLPSNVGIGIANRSLCDGRMLLAFDAVFKQWDETDLFGAVYRNQWALQFGSQYSLGRLRLRSGYVYAQDPIKAINVTTAGGISPPGGIPALQYMQAQFANICQNRISVGVGIVDIRPGMDIDVFAGGMFKESGQLGPFTNVNMESWFVGTGLSYRFGVRGIPKSP